MSINRGKEFEKLIRKYISQVPGVLVERLYDTTNGYINIKNPSDYIIYKKPAMYYIECKSTDGGTLPFSRLSQLDALLERSKIDGVRAGFIIWYKQLKRTYWVDATFVKELKDTNARSINIKTLNAVDDKRVLLISATYPRVYGVYNFEEFFNIIN